MTRARATALALVNWKGVFYERYQLDRHVTALEGANGSGKTTVMIAAYVVLLPDMARLRFTNLGESGATGGDRGIWGRLGQTGRPSYAAMEIALPDGSHVVAAIHLERKAEPSVELTPFLITGLPEEALRRVLLLSDGDLDAVPELADLRAAVARIGGQVEVFATAKEYFAALFEKGVNPLRMATDEDRNKYNDLSRTSMGGGISRALSNELRAFVPKEETGLGDALSRMRQNLDACHRTRVEVAEARRLEHEISGVYDAGQAMFAAALLCVRAEAAERARRTDEARATRDASAKPLLALDEAIAEATARRDARALTREELRGAHRDALARSERTLRGHGLARKLAELSRELIGVAERARVVCEAQHAAALLRGTRVRERDRARDAYQRAAEGLSNLQSGLEELHRNAHARRHARTRLQEAREALGEPTLGEPDLNTTLDRVRERLSRIDVERTRLDRDHQAIALRRGEHARALAALAQVAAGAPLDAPHDLARRTLARLAALEALPARIPELAVERDHTERLAERQLEVRRRTVALGLEGELSALAVERALAAVEADLRLAEEGAGADHERAANARSEGRTARTRADDLERRVLRHQEALSLAARLEEALGFPLRGGGDIARARSRLASDREGTRASIRESTKDREDALRKAAALEASADVHPELLRLRDEIGGELLATRYEDLDIANAARAQAHLGPLADAIVVRDPWEAAKRLSAQPHELPSVWLVAADAPLDRLPVIESEGHEGYLVVRAEHGVRVTRVPEQPTLGRGARARRAGTLRAQTVTLEGDIARSLERLASLDALARDTDRLASEGAVLDEDDPAEGAVRARAEATAADVAARVAEGAAHAARQRAMAARPRVEALRALLGEAFLLDSPDYAERARNVAATLRSAMEARTELRRVERDRAVLAELVDALRTPPPSAEEAIAAVAKGQELDGERTRLFRAREALSDLVLDRRALPREDAGENVEAALTQRESIVPTLKTQLAAARAAVAETEEALRAAENAWEHATRQAQTAAAEQAAIEAHGTRIREELFAEGLVDDTYTSDAALEFAQNTVAERSIAVSTHEEEERRLSTELALLVERRVHAERAARIAAEQAAVEERALGPIAERWERMAQAAETAGVLRDAMGARSEKAYGDKASADLRAEFTSRAEVLIDRLTTARGGGECVPIVRDARKPSAQASAEACLAAWLAVRDWVRRRLPGELADLVQPLDALARLHDRLERLEEHLGRQETDLRGVSGDVARGIDVQLRKAGHQVKQLNRNLDGVTFGGIAGIRVQMRRIDRMEQVLVAIREGAVQELLFQPSLPIEDALDEIFRRYGGGRSGGKRLLDYREYVDLTVEIRRRADGEWEPASSTRMSTGEAIGVGSALIMVVLTEWERNANLLRPKRGGGSMRFLLLDEANRLSQDNLGVLFDLCKHLDVQLLIAAPEVARAEGNTTYRLVRRLTADGGEEVLVSGRRTIRAERAADG